MSRWTSYFEARRQTIEENDSPCRNRVEVTMESLNEQQRFSEHNRSNNKTVTANITGAF